jgi:NADH-quinone oxidoreductase subunit A
MLEQYFPILLFIFVGLAVGVALPLIGGSLSRLLGVNRPDPEKLSPYECGFEAFEDARMKFDVRYYLVAIREIGLFGFISMMVFLAILVVGFIYEWKKGALEWD